MKIYIKLIRVLTLCFAQFFSFYYTSIAQESILLGEYDMKSYELLRQSNSYWPMSADSLNSNVIRQRWSSSDGEYYIIYCEFNNEADALNAVAYMANSCASPFIFGSPTGEIIGNASWVGLDRSAVCFSKGKFGIKVFKPGSVDNNSRNKMGVFI